MSRIIKAGTLEIYRATCPICGCVFEYNAIDVNSCGDVECPYCKRDLDTSAILREEIMPTNGDSDFMEDVRALAKQYGLEIISVEVYER